ncbi:type II toxin-antitoxin system RelE/ParE family toxin [Citrifermentans bremense]|uniref:type II toxin-antitoxin system RelE/ParE family toxin n=1 Tax=Citrifermentans bremense TaxID=60035 RepID=UPI00047898AA|nr:type II toxin-antitoxin system RelE/ParE family toxin [Citrifermentans bremense]
MRRQVLFYKTESGKCPLSEFLDKLPGKAAQKITWTLTLLEELEVVPQTYLKKLVNTEEIWEVRASTDADAYRIFCFFANGSVVVLTHALTKKTQKTPVAEIRTAEAYRRDYLARRKRK